MNNKIQTILRFILLSSLLPVAMFTAIRLQADTVLPLFQNANEAYGKANYTEAIKGYNEVLATGGASATVYYNLANAYFQSGDAGHAVLFYERALAIKPGFAEARHNLGFVRHAASLPPVTETESLLERLATRLTLNEWAWMLCGTFWLSVILIVLPKLFCKWTGLCRIFISVSLAMLIVSSLGLAGAYPQTKRLVSVNKDTPLRVSPLADSSKAGYMAAGEVGSYSESHLGYYLVTSETGKQGWAAASDIGLIWDK